MSVLAEVQDPMRKREEFAVHLRKEKKQKIIEERRKRLKISANPNSVENMEFNDQKMYDCCPLFHEEVS